MSALNSYIDYFSNDFSNLSQESHSHLSSILSSLNQSNDSEIENWDDVVAEHIYLPNKQPKLSQIKQQIAQKLQFNCVQLCVEFYAIKNNNEDNKNLCEKSFEKLENILWKLKTHPNKSQVMDSESWSNLRPKDIYVRDRNTGMMVLQTKAPKTSMPRKPCNVQFVIDRINTLLVFNNSKIQQIRSDRAEQEKITQDALIQEAQSLEPEPELDYDSGTTALHEIDMVPEEPAVEEPAVEEPAVEEPAVEEPVPEEPVPEEPVPEEPAVEEPVPEEPAVEEPAVEEPVVEESAVEEPAVEEPVEGGDLIIEE